MKAVRLALLLALPAALLLPGRAAVATDAPAGTLQSRVDAVLAEFGGTQTAPNQISWDDGATVLDLAPDPATQLPAATPSTLTRATLSVGGCASGRHCIYGGSNYTGDKVTFSGCATTESVALLDGAVRSVANATTGNTVRVYDGSTLLARVAAGRGKNVTGTATRLSCS